MVVSDGVFTCLWLFTHGLLRYAEVLRLSLLVDVNSCLEGIAEREASGSAYYHIALAYIIQL